MYVIICRSLQLSKCHRVAVSRKLVEVKKQVSSNARKTGRSQWLLKTITVKYSRRCFSYFHAHSMNNISNSAAPDRTHCKSIYMLESAILLTVKAELKTIRSHICSLLFPATCRPKIAG